MSLLIGPIFGNGQDGDLVISSDITDSPTDSSCSGSSGFTSLSATNPSFAAGQIILIHQSRGTGVGNLELNQIASYAAGTITTRYPLANTYTDSGASQAQVLVVKQYRSVKINYGVTLFAKGWNGDVGGILPIMCSGKVDVIGTISADGAGFSGGAGVLGSQAWQGEGTIGIGTTSQAANGNGGGGGNQDGGSQSRGGGGGGNGALGANGAGSTWNGTGGGTSGSADLVTVSFGGGGGGGSRGAGVTGSAGSGGSGGGIIFIVAKSISITGSITAKGNAGGNGTEEGSGGGGGAGGSILIRTINGILGTDLITAVGGAGGIAVGGNGSNGGAGGVGRIRVEACSLSGSTNPTASEVVGGHKWCGSLAGIL